MYTDLSYLSREAYDMATDQMLTIDQAISFLEKQLQMRTLSSKIMKFSRGRDKNALKKLLIDGLEANHPNMSRDSHRRRVDKWLDPENTSSLSKQDAIEAAFLLRLTLKEADEFITMVTEEKLHYRSAGEIVFIYGLQNRLSYTETVRLAKRMEEYLADVKDKNPDLLKITDQTEKIRPKVERLDTEEKLRRFLVRETGHLGYLHNTAYGYFSDMINKLVNPVDKSIAKNVWFDDDEKAKEKLGIRSILREYMFSEIIPSAKALSKNEDPVLHALKKEIIRHWPENAGLSRMKHRNEETARRKKNKEKKALEKKNREEDIKNNIITKDNSKGELDNAEISMQMIKEAQTSMQDSDKEGGKKSESLKKYDVTRKVLILLYLATYSDFDEEDIYDEENGCSPYEDNLEEDDLEEEIVTRDEFFQKICLGINTMLADCGFSKMDPRSPFDWIILYSICAEDLLDMDDRMKRLLLQMFPPKE